VEPRAAQKRVARGLEKLRAFFTKRGFTLSATVIAAAIAANSVQAAPAGISAAATTAAATKGNLISATTTLLVKGTMKTMMWLKLKFAASIGAIALLAGGVATVAISQTNSPSGPSAQEIVQRSRAAYAALSSYCDEGSTVASVGSHAVAPHFFSIKLARPNLYRVDWSQDLGFYSHTGMVWSAGNGNFFQMDRSGAPQTNSTMEMALAGATGVSGGAAASIPGTFFKMNWGNSLGATMESAARKPDERIGEADCYVLSETNRGHARSIWIGKEDFLIRQIETFTSAAVAQAERDAQIKKHPELRIPTAVGGDIKSTETHTNIVVNKNFSATDFAPEK
jgi:hypothetical protein